MTPAILIADQFCMSIKGIKKFLEEEFGFREVDSVQSCKALLSSLREKKYTHIVTDLHLLDGPVLDTLLTIQDLYPQTEIMVCGHKGSNVYERGLLNFGVHYYLPKAATHEVISSKFRQFIYEQGQSRSAKKEPGSPFSSLTNRQQEVMHYLLNGKSVNQIAEAFHVKSNTVSTIKKQLLERTDTKNIMELAELAHLFRHHTPPIPSPLLS